jgi:hypothetical protein
MQVFDLILSLLLGMRAHIPGQPRFGSGPSDMSHGVLRAVMAFLITAFFVIAMVWLAVRLVLELL